MINSDTLFLLYFRLPQYNSVVYELWEVIFEETAITAIFSLSLGIKDHIA